MPNAGESRPLKEIGEVIREFRMYARFFFHEHDTTSLGLGLSKTQISILMRLDELAGASMSEVSRSVGLEKSSFTRAVDGMVEQGFLARVRGEGDRRVVRLGFLPRGKEAVSRVREDWERNLEALLERFDASERDAFRRALAEVSRGMARLMGGKPS